MSVEAWRYGGMQTDMSVSTWRYGGMEACRRVWRCRHRDMEAFDGYVGVDMFGMETWRC
jgi:hypothetical protein